MHRCYFVMSMLKNAKRSSTISQSGSETSMHMRSNVTSLSKTNLKVSCSRKYFEIVIVLHVSIPTRIGYTKYGQTMVMYVHTFILCYMRLDLSWLKKKRKNCETNKSLCRVSDLSVKENLKLIQCILLGNYMANIRSTYNRCDFKAFNIVLKITGWILFIL